MRTTAMDMILDQSYRLPVPNPSRLAGPLERLRPGTRQLGGLAARAGERVSRRASNSSRVGLMTTGLGIRSSRGSWVLRPLPVMQMTIESSRPIRPCSISFWATARVTPPAVSAQMPSVSARSLMASMIASSSTSSLQPPVSWISLEAK